MNSVKPKIKSNNNTIPFKKGSFWGCVFMFLVGAVSYLVLVIALGFNSGANRPAYMSVLGWVSFLILITSITLVILAFAKKSMHFAKITAILALIQILLTLGFLFIPNYLSQNNSAYKVRKSMTGSCDSSGNNCYGEVCYSDGSCEPSNVKNTR